MIADVQVPTGTNTILCKCEKTPILVHIEAISVGLSEEVLLSLRLEGQIRVRPQSDGGNSIPGMSTKATVRVHGVLEKLNFTKAKGQKEAKKMGRNQSWTSKQYQRVEGLINHFKELGKGLGQKI